MEAIDLSHLDAEFRQFAMLPNAERKDLARRDLWIPYEAADSLLTRCESILSAPRSIRPENLLIVAPSNNGKSSLLQQFRERHPPDENPGGDNAYVPFLLIENPAKPDERRMYEAILAAINVPHKLTATAGEMEAQVWEQLTLLKTRVLGLDEFHDILAGGPRQQMLMLNVLKKFGNKLGISIIAAGISDAELVLKRDIQLDNRFEKRLLPPWASDRSFVQMVAEIVCRLPLRRPTDLQDKNLLRRIFARSQQTLGGINAVLRKAAIHAIDSGAEAIDLYAVNNSEYQEPTVSAALLLRSR